MSVAGLLSADEIRLRGARTSLVRLVARPPGFGQGELALVDASRGGPVWSLWRQTADRPLEFVGRFVAAHGYDF